MMTDGASKIPRRIVAVVMPQLGCELVRQKKSVEGPLAVLFGGQADADGASSDKATATLDLVDELAFRYGVRPGQRVAEAQATLAELSIHKVLFTEIDEALGRVAEVCLGLGTTASIRLRPEEDDDDKRRGPSGDAPFDTVWLDITGAAHLVGGEEALVDELAERIRALGHKTQIAIATGPRIARSLARYAQSAVLTGPLLQTRKIPSVSVIAKSGASVLGPLPIHALPLDLDKLAFFGRLGVFTVDALSKLPRAELAPRLGSSAAEVLELCAGRDTLPLVPYSPPRVLVEEMSFEDPIAIVEPILFVLRSMTSRIAARLAARGESCLTLEMTLPLDRSILRIQAPLREPVLSLVIELPSALSDEADLHRALRAKLERVELYAPATGLRLSISQIVSTKQIQMDLSRDKATRPDALPTLLAELSAEIGADRVGILEIQHAHRPESRSKLVPVGDLDTKKKAREVDEEDELEVVCPTEHFEEGNDAPLPEPTRLFAIPVSIGRIVKGAVIAVDNRLYVIEHLKFVMRLDGVEWWTRSPASRDYGLAWLVSGASTGTKLAAGKEFATRAAGLAWVYVDRSTGEGYLQGFCD